MLILIVGLHLIAERLIQTPVIAFAGQLELIDLLAFDAMVIDSLHDLFLLPSTSVDMLYETATQVVSRISLVSYHTNSDEYTSKIDENSDESSSQIYINSDESRSKTHIYSPSAFSMASMASVLAFSAMSM